MNHNIITTMLKQYDCRSLQETKNALKEIIHTLVLLGLARSSFFTKASFYGGTCLRKFFHLERFSEDLDFTLLEPDPSYTLEPYIDNIQTILRSYGFHVEITIKEKSISTPIHSAFVKGNTLLHIVNFTPLHPPISGIPRNEKITVKIEIDTDPPEGAHIISKTQAIPELFQVKMYDLPSQAAGKVAALISRSWKHRTKGRDFFDYLWFLQNSIPVNLNHLQHRLAQKDNQLLPTEQEIRELLVHRFTSVDFNEVIQDILPFIPQNRQNIFDSWSCETFLTITEELLAFT